MIRSPNSPPMSLFYELQKRVTSTKDEQDQETLAGRGATFMVVLQKCGR